MIILCKYIYTIYNIHSQGRAATGCRSTPGTRSSPTGDTANLLSPRVTCHDQPRVPASTWATSPSSTWMTLRTGSPWSTTRPPCSHTRAARSSSTAARTGTGSSVTSGYVGIYFTVTQMLIRVFCTARNEPLRCFHNNNLHLDEIAFTFKTLLGHCTCAKQLLTYMKCELGTPRKGHLIQ